jgi:uncharacterized damage-inducible protein DinB
MFRKIEDFLAGWEYETEATLKVFRALTDESLQGEPHPDLRTLGRLAWHIAQTIPEMGGRAGLKLEGPGGTDPIPTSAAEIGARYEEAADSLAREVSFNWTEKDLEVEDEMYGEKWPRGKTLASLVTHQAHHRGQMTILMRQAGLKVPGVYGPSKEEWEAFRMPAQE